MRNTIVTLLIEKEIMRRGEIHTAMRDRQCSESSIDNCLRELVKDGLLFKPFPGYYRIVRNNE